MSPAKTKQSPAKTKQPPAARREPIQVGILKFCPARSPDNGIPGSMSTAVTDRRWPKSSRASRHQIEYHPWIRCFQVTHFPPEGAPHAVFVPEHNVQIWHPLEQPEAAQE